MSFLSKGRHDLELVILVKGTKNIKLTDFNATKIEVHIKCFLTIYQYIIAPAKVRIMNVCTDSKRTEKRKNI